MRHSHSVFPAPLLSHLLSAEELEVVSNLFENGLVDECEYRLCDELPADDASLTCFLRPESWDIGSTSKEQWFCMRNPSPTTQPSIGSDDSY